MQFPKDGTQVWSKLKKRHPTLHNPDTTRQIQEKPFTSERGCNTNHSSRAKRTQATILRFHYSQYKGMCILSHSALSRNLPSVMKEIPILQFSVPLHQKVFQQWKRSKSKNPEDHPGYQNHLNAT